VITELSELALRCPWCHGKIARAVSDEDEFPHKGDYGFCKGCGEVFVFTDRTDKKRGLAVRKPSFAERFLIATHPGIKKMRAKRMT